MLEGRRGAPEERKSVPFRALAAIGLLGFGAAAVGAWFAYRDLVHYEPRAARHLLPGTDRAARLDVEQVVLFEPVRRHLVPLLNAPLSRAFGLRESPDRVRALREVAGINLGLDLREILIAHTPRGEWQIALGGLFPTQGLVGRIESILQGEGVEGLGRIGDVLVFEPSGAALGQAKDGILILSNSRAALERALTGNESYRELGMPLEGAGSMVLTSGGMRGWLPWFFDTPDASGMEKLSGSSLTLHLERPLRVEVVLHGADAESARHMLAAAQSHLSFESMQKIAIPTTDWGAEPALLARASVQPGSPKASQLITFLELSELGSGLAALATWIERELATVRAGH